MITLEKVQSILTKEKLSPLNIELFTHMYADLPYEDRQTCAQQLVEDPSLASVLYELLKNKNSFNKTSIDADTFRKKELSILSSHLTA